VIRGQNHCRTWWDDFVRNIYRTEERVLLLETLSRYGRFNAADLASIQLTPNLWKTETVTAWYRILKKEASVPNRDAELAKAENILKSRINFQGSLMNLQGDLDWEAQWRLFSSRDQEAMGVFGIAIENDGWAEDVGRLARGITARLKAGHWDTTLANAWGLTQLRKFSAKFEKVKVEGETKAVSLDQSGIFNWKKTPYGETQLLGWPKGSDKDKVKVEFTHSGAGKPWIHFETLSAIPLKAPFNLGYKVAKTVTPVEQKKPGSWSLGDVANVELTVTANADQAWVVIRDPVPAGSSHLGTGLDGASAILDRAPPSKARYNPNEPAYWPVEFTEKSHANFIAYAAYLPRGVYKISYRVRLNSAGELKLPPTRVEAMYAPETFGETPNANWKVAP
ncbi:MAG TPA: hypothetical protein VFV50_14210, partial [Bdellovibrionales bacterium]|nr:hypothetical protein [Bdellovibrionales bacterium]